MINRLNQHKRTHNQDGDHNNEAITVVTQPQQLVQGQNLISESGQNLGQIQIVATETIESGQIIQQHTSEVIQPHKAVVDKSQKCITCGVSIISNPKRKGPKLIRCETCINNSMVRRKFQHNFL
jgi:KRAB domain-containing zinc finger protein